MTTAIKPPFPKKLPRFTLPDFERFEIAPGIPVILCRNSTVPLVTLSFSINQGSRNDTLPKQGLTQLTMQVLNEGGGDFTSSEFHDRIDDLGSSIVCFSNEDYARIQITSLRENFADTLALLSLMLVKPIFSETDYAREKNNLMVRLTQLADRPEIIADKVFNDNLFAEDHPYYLNAGGKKPTLESITLVDVQNRFKSILQSGHSEIFCAGDIDAVSLKELLSASLSGLSTRNPVFTKALLPIVQKPACILIAHKEGAEQTEVMFGHQSVKSTETDHISRTAANSLFGGQFSSRLNLNLREKHGITYGVHSYFNSLQLCGEFIISTSVAGKDSGTAIEQVFVELEKIRTKITNKELAFVKASMVNRFALNFETSMHLIMNSLMLRAGEMTEDYIKNFVPRVGDLTVDMLLASAREHFLPENMQVVLVGDKTEIEKSLITAKINLPVRYVDIAELW